LRGVLQLEGLEVFAERAAHIVAAQCEFDRCFEETELIAGVVTLAVEFKRVNRTAAELVTQSVGELDLAARARFNVIDGLENIRRSPDSTCSCATSSAASIAARARS
jgi:hypothetical protein